VEFEGVNEELRSYPEFFTVVTLKIAPVRMGQGDRYLVPL